MPNRIIKESIRTSKDINSLTDFQFRVWAYLITYVDDYGRGSADPELLKGLVFPRRKGVTEKQIEEVLAVLSNSGMIALYEVDGEPYFYFTAWDKHQQIRAKKSKFPEPLISDDIICNQLISDDIICSRNPIQSNPIQNPNTNTNGAKPHARFVPPTLEEVKAYCAERHNNVNVERFMAFYEANGWVQGKGKPIKDWKATVRTWEDSKPHQDGEVRHSKYASVKIN